MMSFISCGSCYFDHSLDLSAASSPSTSHNPQHFLLVPYFCSSFSFRPTTIHSSSHCNRLLRLLLLQSSNPTLHNLSPCKHNSFLQSFFPFEPPAAILMRFLSHPFPISTELLLASTCQEGSNASSLSSCKFPNLKSLHGALAKENVLFGGSMNLGLSTWPGTMQAQSSVL